MCVYVCIHIIVDAIEYNKSHYWSLDLFELHLLLYEVVLFWGIENK